MVKGLCHAESLTAGTLDLEVIARLNDALDLAAENERRINEALSRKTRPHGR